MRYIQIIMIQHERIATFHNYTISLWNKMYNNIEINEKIHLGRWNTCEDDRKKEIKSIWASSDNCGDHICGKPEVIREITNIIKTNDE